MWWEFIFWKLVFCSVYLLGGKVEISQEHISMLLECPAQEACGLHAEFYFQQQERDWNVHYRLPFHQNVNVCGNVAIRNAPDLRNSPKPRDKRPSILCGELYLRILGWCHKAECQVHSGHSFWNMNSHLDPNNLECDEPHLDMSQPISRDSWLNWYWIWEPNSASILKYITIYWTLYVSIY
jgi:hypothetical protein